MTGGRLTIELARLVAATGRVTHADVVARTLELTGAINSVRRPSGESNGSMAQALTRKAMKPRERAGIVRRDGDAWLVDDLDELARIVAA